MTYKLNLKIIVITLMFLDFFLSPFFHVSSFMSFVMSAFKTAERNLCMQWRRLIKDIESVITVAASSEGLTKEDFLTKKEEL